MAYMPLDHVHPNLYDVYYGPTWSYSIERDPILLLIEEVIDYSLRYYNLQDWVPPVNLSVARLLNEFTYFNENFASNVLSPDIERNSLWLARRHGFGEEIWLNFIDPSEARRYQEYYLMTIYLPNKPRLFEMFSFACYASRIAIQRNRYGLVTQVVWALLAVFREILSNEEYYQRYYFVEYQLNQHLNQPQEVDEGIVDEGNGSNNDASSFNDNPILLFVEEFIDFLLRYDNLHGWIPPFNLETLRDKEVGYFTENFGRAISHFCAEENVVDVARELGFNEERWLELYIPSEARNFQCYFLQQLLNHSEFYMFSFACHSSRLAMRINRNSLVNEVVLALFNLLRQHYPDEQYYKEFDRRATEYILHLHSDSDDGVHSVENEVIDSDDNDEADTEEDASASSHSDGERNETEESNSRSSIAGNEAESVSDTSEGEGECSASGESISDTSEGESVSDTSEESGCSASEDSGSDISEEESGPDTLQGENGSDTLEGENGYSASDESGSDSSDVDR